VIGMGLEKGGQYADDHGWRVLSVGRVKEEGECWQPWSPQQGRVCGRHWGRVDPRRVEYQDCFGYLQGVAAMRLPE